MGAIRLQSSARHREPSTSKFNGDNSLDHSSNVYAAQFAIEADEIPRYGCTDGP